MKPETVVRMKKHGGDYAIPSRTIGIVEQVDEERGEYSHFVKWNRSIGHLPHQKTWTPESMLEPVPDDA